MESLQTSSTTSMQDIEASLSSLNLKDSPINWEEIIQKQATINIGTIGHVAHGKSTVVKAVSGVHTVRFKKEIQRNITIKLGYANAKIFKCRNEECPKPDCYTSCKSSQFEEPTCERPGCGSKMRLVKHVSFVDCPGHDILMATMLNGAAVMDSAFLLISANEPCPQPQTSEHLAAVEIMKLNNILILQNKIDLVRKESASKQYSDIQKFIKNTSAKNSSIIPISGQLKYNVNAICQYIDEKIPQPIRELEKRPRMIVIRSFDINKPGADIEGLKGGVAGGSLIQGVLKVGDKIEIRPGALRRDNVGGLLCEPLITTVTSLFAEGNSLDVAIPGGLIGVGTLLDPCFCRGDHLVGQVIGHVGFLPDIFSAVEIDYFLLQKLLGVQASEEDRVMQLKNGEIILLNIGSTSTGGKVLSSKGNQATIQFIGGPVCSDIGEKVALSRRFNKHWRLIGWGNITSGKVITPSYQK
eukprot:GHVP01028718.1.p1 GENE.GHVP01028718.1~~GHVP01028718.1.p1  ORF type:complete len:469 (-),score=78.36 GHVP01028718.1:14-1420(-)